MVSRPFIKSATPTFQQSETNKQNAAKLIFQLPLAALALGAVGRGLFGLRDLFTTQSLQPPGIVPGTQFISMPRIAREEEEAKKKQLPKVAAGSPTDYQPSTHLLGRAADVASKPFYEHVLAGPDKAGSNTWNVAGVPWTYSLGLPLALLALGGGYKGMDMLMDSRRRQERKQELDKTKQQYYQLLQGKLAGEAELFDRLAEKTAAELEKTAQPVAAPAVPKPQPAAPPATDGSIVDYIPGGEYLRKEYMPQVGGMAANTYLATALLAALGAGKLSYDHFRSNSKRKTLEEALRRRAAAQEPSSAMVYTE